ncbi:MAG: carbohydrate ABC transporter permease [Anaerolineales bacterium]
MSKSNDKTLLDILAYIVLIIGALTMLIPFLWMISVSLREPAQQFSRDIIPDPITLKNYVDLFEELPNQAFFYLTYNSFKLSILAVVGQVLTCAMAAFVFAIVKFKGRDFLFALLLGTLMIPSQVSLIPDFIIFRYLGLIGTQWPLILPAFWGGAFGTFLLRQYFLKIPRDLVDAARMDGASLFEIFWRVYMPLSKPAVAALSIFVFKDSWNDLLHPLIYLPTDMSQTTLTVGLAFFQQQLQAGGKFTVLMAGAFLSIVPLLIIFFIAQKQFIEGIALSGLKR